MVNDLKFSYSLEEKKLELDFDSTEIVVVANSQQLLELVVSIENSLA